VRQGNDLSAAASSLRMTAGMARSLSEGASDAVTTLEIPSVTKPSERRKDRDLGR
jgi:hypothetical protein